MNDLPEIVPETPSPTEEEIRAFMRDIGARGGKATGSCKRRSEAHYRKMVDARNAQRAAVRAARQDEFNQD